MKQTHYQILQQKINTLKERCGVKTVSWNKLTNNISNSIHSIPGFNDNEGDKNLIDLFNKTRYEQKSFQVPYLTEFNNISTNNKAIFYANSFQNISNLELLKTYRNDILYSLHTKIIVQLNDYYSDGKINFHINNEDYYTNSLDDLGINLKELLINDILNYQNQIEISGKKSRKIHGSLHFSIAQIQTMGRCLSVIEKIGELIEEGKITQVIEINKAIASISKDLLFIALNYPLGIYSKFIDVFVDFGRVEKGNYPFIDKECFTYNMKTSELLINNDLFNNKPSFCNIDKRNTVHRGCPFAFFKGNNGKGNLFLITISEYLNNFKKYTLENYYPEMFNK